MQLFPTPVKPSRLKLLVRSCGTIDLDPSLTTTFQFHFLVRTTRIENQQGSVLQRQLYYLRLTSQMNAQAAARAKTATSQLSRRSFHSTRSQLASPFHYPEGPRSNLPFNTQTRFFAFRYWTFMGELMAIETKSFDVS
jgi:cytochrome c oxidase subunit 7c